MSKLIIGGYRDASGVVYGIRMLKTLFVVVGNAIGWFIPKYPESCMVRDQPVSFFALRALWRYL